MNMAYEAPPHLKLWPIEGLTSVIVCGTGSHYVCELHGPFYDTDVPVDAVGDSRIFVVYRKLRGQVTLAYLVQDADDDAFLNSTAMGAEKYDTGPVVIR